MLLLMLLALLTLTPLLQVTKTIDGGSTAATQKWMRLFMAPGVAHCGMDTTPYFDALVAWTENNTAPETIMHAVGGPNSTTRPLCPHPHVALYKGSGSTDVATNFECGPNPVDASGRVDEVEVVNRRQNLRIFGQPYIPSAPCPGCPAEKNANGGDCTTKQVTSLYEAREPTAPLAQPALDIVWNNQWPQLCKDEYPADAVTRFGVRANANNDFNVSAQRAAEANHLPRHINRTN